MHLPRPTPPFVIAYLEREGIMQANLIVLLYLCPVCSEARGHEHTEPYVTAFCDDCGFPNTQCIVRVRRSFSVPNDNKKQPVEKKD